MSYRCHACSLTSILCSVKFLALPRIGDAARAASFSAPGEGGQSSAHSWPRVSPWLATVGDGISGRAGATCPLFGISRHGMLLHQHWLGFRSEEHTSEL